MTNTPKHTRERHLRSRAVHQLTARDVAAQVITRVLDDGAFVGPALSSALDASGLDGRDRRLATEIAMGALRFCEPLRESLRRATNKGGDVPAVLLPHMLVAAYQLQHMSERIPSHAAVNECVNAVKRFRPHHAGFANAVLRHIGSALHLQLRKDASVDDIARAYGIPHTLADVTVAGVPAEQWREELSALCETPTLSVTFLDDAARLSSWNQRVLDEKQPNEAGRPSPHHFVAGSLSLHVDGRVEEIPGFSDGAIIVQDPGSLLVAQLVDGKPGETIVDLCAAPGTKSVWLKRCVGKSGRVLAVEHYSKRSLKIRENAVRTKCDLEIVVADGTEWAPGDAIPASGDARVDAVRIDAVLIDAPCSSLGTTRRRPDVKLQRSSDEDHATLLELQRRLLQNAASMVTSGGRIVYAVCTPMPDEGKEQVKRFLDENPGFHPRSVREVVTSIPSDAVTPDGFLQLSVRRHKTDAFFAAVLQKGNV